MSVLLWTVAGVSGLVSLVAPFALRPILSRWDVLDVPNQRSSHEKPTLRGGGVAPLIGLMVAGSLALFYVPQPSLRVLAIVLAAAVVMGVVGLAEDVRGLPIAVRAGSQFIVGGAVALTLSASLGVNWIWVPLAALGFAAHVNFTNFMDGVNGISGLHGLVVGSAFAVLGIIANLPWLEVLGLAVAAAFLAFLPWNLLPPGMFLGDVGSYLLGGALGAASIAAITLGVSPIAALSPLAIYWADTVVTLFRRLFRGEPVFDAHRTHAYQRLTNTGLSHITVSLIVAAVTVGTSLLGLLAAVHVLHWALAALGVLVLSVVYVLLPRFRGDRLPLDRSKVRLLMPRRSSSALRAQQDPKESGWK